MNTVVINSSSDTSYDCLFEGWRILHESSADSPYIPWDEVTMVLLVGDSTDVDPNLYGEVPSTECGSINRHQDLEAFRFIERAFYENEVAVIGICKGAQQLCVYHDGKLIQHVPYVGEHLVTDVDGRSERVMADHHQVMVPDPEYTIEAVNTETGYPEIVYSDDHVFGRWAAIQFHPEWCDSPSHGVNLFNYWRSRLCGI
jgi:gamma-glutamyl-gamma-aminobutyrate hydrolase PuuD